MHILCIKYLPDNFFRLLSFTTYNWRRAVETLHLQLQLDDHDTLCKLPLVHSKPFCLQRRYIGGIVIWGKMKGKGCPAEKNGFYLWMSSDVVLCNKIVKINFLVKVPNILDILLCIPLLPMMVWEDFGPTDPPSLVGSTSKNTVYKRAQ